MPNNTVERIIEKTVQGARWDSRINIPKGIQ